MSTIGNQHIIYLGLGSNLGDKETNIKKALSEITCRIGEIGAVSSFYLTRPVGFESDNDFINCVCSAKTDLNPFEVLEYTKDIEKELGRKSKSVNKQYKDRIIDIDILLYDSMIIDNKNLILPHPHFHERKFVLEPLREIAPGLTHPVLNKTISELYLELQEI